MEYIVVGHVIGQLGIKGEVKIEVLTDFPDRFAPGNRAYVDGHPLTIERSRPHKDRLALKFFGIDDIEAASQLRGRNLEIPIDQIHELPVDEYYRFQILGLEVFDMQGEPVGKIDDILPTGSNDVYIVTGPRGEVLIPAIDDVIKSIDIQKGQMVIQVIDGLL